MLSLQNATRNLPAIVALLVIGVAISSTPASALANAFWRLDGDPSPPDWMIESPQKQSLREDVVTLLALLRGY